jgi:oligoendopeptidase F
MQLFSAPTWDNSAEYPSISSTDFREDFEKALLLIADMESASLPISKFILAKEVDFSEDAGKSLLIHVKNFLKSQLASSEILNNLSTFLACELSVSPENISAKQWSESVRRAWAQYYAAFDQLNELFVRIPETWVELFLRDDQIHPWEFRLYETRKLRDQRLAPEAERLLISLDANGLQSWANLYTQVASSIRIDVNDGGKTKEIGLGASQGYLQNRDSKIRETTWRALQGAWKDQGETCAAIFNNMAGWRLEVCKQRSISKTVNFLDESMHSNRINKKTLETIIGVLQERKSVGQKAVKFCARISEKEQLDPWDLQAPAPAHICSDEKIDFASAIEIIRAAFHKVSPEMGNFVTMMQKNNWIEAQVNNSKRSGASSPKFAKSRTPRVYMSYFDTLADVLILAHELGHAFHFWVMRDLPQIQLMCPMTLAETASVFSEFIVLDYVLSQPQRSRSLLAAQWGDAQNVALYLVNIPARFEFEKAAYERRREGILTANELSELTSISWKNWYGDTLSETEDYFWASKAHFHMTKATFYNFPYAFAYLFSIGLLAQQKRFDGDFYGSFVGLLRDTGRMSVETLAAKHLAVDITQPEFWHESLDVISKRLDSGHEHFTA